jgi:ribonuclease PH
MPRIDGRNNEDLRPVRIQPGYLEFAEGSALIEVGHTRVVCSVSIEERVPPFRRGQGVGWVTAEYAMLPRATLSRTPRESTLGKVGGRTHEIQRLIGRSLRSVIDMSKLGERTFQIDCDVLQADGGTRTAAITGAYVALYQSLLHLQRRGFLRELPLTNAVAAASVGVVRGEAMLDLCYEEDAGAEVDFNVVMTGDGDYVEIQGTAEGRPFSRSRADALLELAAVGIRKLLAAQQEAISGLTPS